MAENKRNIPIQFNRDLSIIDSEFGTIRERFDAEMRRMEDEMNKFRSELMNRESNFFETTSSSTTSNNSLSRAQSNVSDINSPLIQEDGDNKVLKLRFDVSQYAPEEIVVKTVDNKLMVHAKHEEKTDTKSVYREYNREFLLPKNVNPESIRSSLSKDGVLTVDAPLPAITGPGEKMIPIAHN